MNLCGHDRVCIGRCRPRRRHPDRSLPFVPILRQSRTPFRCRHRIYVGIGYRSIPANSKTPADAVSAAPFWSTASPSSASASSRSTNRIPPPWRSMRPRFSYGRAARDGRAGRTLEQSPGERAPLWHRGTRALWKRGRRCIEGEAALDERCGMGEQRRARDRHHRPTRISPLPKHDAPKEKPSSYALLTERK